ncbi:MAG: MFS transporter [Pseudomonadota bacterium]
MHQRVIQTGAYALPALALIYVQTLLGLYGLKFATDVLLISPAIIGVILAIGRIWDGIADPIIGYLSDRSASNSTGRKAWILWSTVPTAVFFYVLFSPPALQESSLLILVTLCVIGFSTGLTAITVPHLALGVEIEKGSAERVRVFGSRHGFAMFGSLLAIATMGVFISAEEGGRVSTRQTVSEIALYVSVIFVVLLSATYAVKELPSRPTPKSIDFKTLVIAIIKNSDARWFYSTIMVEFLGAGAVGIMMIYVMQYVVGLPNLAPLVIGAYLIAQIASVPIWVKFSPRLDARSAWSNALLISGLLYIASFTVLFIQSGTTQAIVLAICAITTGIANSCASTLSPVALGAIIDTETAQNGTDKQATFFAFRSLSHKLASAVTVVIIGIGLGLTSFEPNVEQSQMSKAGIMALFSLLPGMSMLLASCVVHIWRKRKPSL